MWGRLSGTTPHRPSCRRGHRQKNPSFILTLFYHASLAGPLFASLFQPPSVGRPCREVRPNLNIPTTKSKFENSRESWLYDVSMTCLLPFGCVCRQDHDVYDMRVVIFGPRGDCVVRPRYVHADFLYKRSRTVNFVWTWLPGPRLPPTSFAYLKGFMYRLWA